MPAGCSLSDGASRLSLELQTLHTYSSLTDSTAGGIDRGERAVHVQTAIGLFVFAVIVANNLSALRSS